MTHYIQGNKDKEDSNFSSDTMQARRQWSNICTVLKEKLINLEFCNFQTYTI